MEESPSRRLLSSQSVPVRSLSNPETIAVLQIPLVVVVSAWGRTRGLAVSVSFWATSMLAVWVIGLIAGVLAIALVGVHLVVPTIGEILHQPLVG